MDFQAVGNTATSSQYAALRQIEENQVAYQQKRINDVRAYFAAHLNNPFEPKYRYNMDELSILSVADPKNPTQPANPELAELMEKVFTVYSASPAARAVAVATQPAPQPVAPAAAQVQSRKRSAAAEKKEKQQLKFNRVEENQLESIKELLKKADKTRGFHQLCEFTEKFPENKEAQELLTQYTSAPAVQQPKQVAAPLRDNEAVALVQEYDALRKANWEQEKALVDQVEPFFLGTEGYLPKIGTVDPCYLKFLSSLALAITLYGENNVIEMTKQLSATTESPVLDSVKTKIFTEVCNGVPLAYPLITKTMAQTINTYGSVGAKQGSTPNEIRELIKKEHALHKKHMTVLQTQLERIRALTNDEIVEESPKKTATRRKKT